MRGRWIVNAVDGLADYPHTSGTRQAYGFTTVDEGLDLIEQAYPGRPIPAKVKILRGLDAALKSTTSKAPRTDVCVMTVLSAGVITRASRPKSGC